MNGNSLLLNSGRNRCGCCYPFCGADGDSPSGSIVVSISGIEMCAANPQGWVPAALNGVFTLVASDSINPVYGSGENGYTMTIPNGLEDSDGDFVDLRFTVYCGGLITVFIGDDADMYAEYFVGSVSSSIALAAPIPNLRVIAGCVGGLQLGYSGTITIDA